MASNQQQKASTGFPPPPLRSDIIDITLALQGLGSAQMEAILAMMEYRAYSSGACIFQFGEPHRGIYLVKKGLVEEFRLTESGTRLPIDRAGPGELFALSSLEGNYCCSAEAVNDSVIGWLSFQKLEDICGKYPRFAMNLVRILTKRLGEVEERLEDLALKTLRARVASALLQLYAVQGPSLKPITHEALSEWAVSSRPKVSMVLEEAQRAGLIQLSRGEIQIVNPAGLQEWAKL
ncbi:MAG: Crp/Fnr family transcriptional regulator [Dehalococcoidia bacterium]